MAKNPKIPETDKRLDALAVETEKNKRALVAQLRRTPTVQSACQATGVGRSTYYKWRAHDFVFGRAADSAIEAGKFLVNDMAEAQIMRMIREGNITACIFWLKYNHPAYAKRHIHEHDIVCDRESTEERHIDNEEFLKMVALHHPSSFNPEIVKAALIEESQQPEISELDKKLEAYREEPDGS